MISFKLKSWFIFYFYFYFLFLQKLNVDIHLEGDWSGSWMMSLKPGSVSIWSVSAAAGFCSDSLTWQQKTKKIIKNCFYWCRRPALRKEAELRWRPIRSAKINRTYVHVHNSWSLQGVRGPDSSASGPLETLGHLQRHRRTNSKLQPRIRQTKYSQGKDRSWEILILFVNSRWLPQIIKLN